jgi:hypothetical protein
MLGLPLKASLMSFRSRWKFPGTFRLAPLPATSKSARNWAGALTAICSPPSGRVRNNESTSPFVVGRRNSRPPFFRTSAGGKSFRQRHAPAPTKPKMVEPSTSPRPAPPRRGGSCSRVFGNISDWIGEGLMMARAGWFANPAAGHCSFLDAILTGWTGWGRSRGGAKARSEREEADFPTPGSPRLRVRTRGRRPAPSPAGAGEGGRRPGEGSGVMTVLLDGGGRHSIWPLAPKESRFSLGKPDSWWNLPGAVPAPADGLVGLPGPGIH